MNKIPNYNELIEEAKRGSANAFGEIYRLFLDRIYRFIYSMVLDETLAEDITQETFLKAWKFLPKFSLKKGTFQAFLYRVARNSVIDYQRKKKDLRLPKESENFIPDNINLEKNYEDSENGEYVLQILKKLPKFERQIVILRYFEEMSHKDIAHVVGKKENTVRVRVHRALRILRKDIKKTK